MAPKLNQADKASALKALGLEMLENPTVKDVRNAYKRLALSFHPDKNPDLNAASQFVVIQEAHDLLMETMGSIDTDTDPVRHAAYTEATSHPFMHAPPGSTQRAQHPFPPVPRQSSPASDEGVTMRDSNGNNITIPTSLAETLQNARERLARLKQKKMKKGGERLGQEKGKKGEETMERDATYEDMSGTTPRMPSSSQENLPYTNPTQQAYNHPDFSQSGYSGSVFSDPESTAPRYTSQYTNSYYGRSSRATEPPYSGNERMTLNEFLAATADPYHNPPQAPKRPWSGPSFTRQRPAFEERTPSHSRKKSRTENRGTFAAEAGFVYASTSGFAPGHVPGFAPSAPAMPTRAPPPVPGPHQSPPPPPRSTSASYPMSEVLSDERLRGAWVNASWKRNKANVTQALQRERGAYAATMSEAEVEIVARAFGTSMMAELAHVDAQRRAGGSRQGDARGGGLGYARGPTVEDEEGSN